MKKSNKVVASINIDERLLRDVDVMADRTYNSRSGMICQCIREHLKSQGFYKEDKINGNETDIQQ